MENKIQPSQYQSYALNTPDGNLNIVAGSDSFDFYLLDVITGDFSVTGSLKVNGVNVSSPNSSNFFDDENGNQIFGGSDNFATGTNNSILWAFNCEVSGNKNTVILGENSNIADGVEAAVSMGGNILNTYNGAVVFADSEVSRQKTSSFENSFTLDYTGGHHFAQPNYFTDDIFVDQTSSGLFSGNLSVDGIIYNTGSPVQNLQNLVDASGAVQDSVNLNKTAFDIHSGFLETGHLDLISSQSIYGNKTFQEDVSFTSGIQIDGSGNAITPVYSRSQTSVTGLNVGISSKGSVFVIVDNDGDGDYSDKTQEFTKNGFFVGVGGSSPDSSTDIFGVSPSGLGWFRQGLVVGDGANVYVPPAFNSQGVKGQIAYDATYFYLATGTNEWGRVAVAPW